MAKRKKKNLWLFSLGAGTMSNCYLFTIFCISENLNKGTYLYSQKKNVFFVLFMLPTFFVFRWLDGLCRSPSTSSALISLPITNLPLLGNVFYVCSSLFFTVIFVTVILFSQDTQLPKFFKCFLFALK